MLISEQSVRTIKECADRVVVIDRGMTVYDGKPAEFEADPEIARKYLMVAEQ
jgi:branched-chain amino acid transport system ATP-binding protein